MLEQGIQMSDMIFRVNIFANSFALLDRLASKGNSETQAVYRILVNGLLVLYRDKTSDRQIDQVSTELILKGFKTIFSENEE